MPSCRKRHPKPPENHGVPRGRLQALALALDVHFLGANVVQLRCKFGANLVQIVSLYPAFSRVLRLHRFLTYAMVIADGEAFRDISHFTALTWASVCNQWVAGSIPVAGST